MINAPLWLIRKTRLLNLFHRFYIVKAYSQMNHDEKAVLSNYARNAKKALEIGTFMGVSANIIALNMSVDGSLYCVDPFLPRNGKRNPGLIMAERDLKRNKIFHKVKFLIGLSTDSSIKNQIPENLDFIFIDGDHTYQGLANDWTIVKQKLRPGGIVCLHDTIIPKEESHRTFGSVKYYNEEIVKELGFKLIDTCYSMTVLKRINLTE